MNSSLALKDFQDTSYITVIEESPTCALVVVKKPAVAVGSVISYQWGTVTAQLPILAIKKDFWGSVSQYTVPSLFPEHGVFMQLAATDSLHILSISEPQPIIGKHWYLLAALEAGRMVGRYMDLASRHKAKVFSITHTAPMKTSKGYGFHDEIDTHIIEGDSAKYEKRMERARQWRMTYYRLIELYKAA